MTLSAPFPLLLWCKSISLIPHNSIRPRFREILLQIVQETLIKRGKFSKFLVTSAVEIWITACFAEQLRLDVAMLKPQICTVITVKLVIAKQNITGGGRQTLYLAKLESWKTMTVRCGYYSGNSYITLTDITYRSSRFYGRRSLRRWRFFAYSLASTAFA